MKKFRFRFRLFVEEEYRPLRAVSPWLWLALGLGLAAQALYNALALPPPTARAEELTRPPGAGVFQVGALGDPAALSRMVMLSLQSFDNQPGISVPFQELNYEAAADWLSVAAALDPRSDYPHFAAARAYGGVRDPARKRVMIEWIRDQFARSPKLRWEWMAHAVTDARHGILKDPELSLQLARELREKTKPGEAPNWARHMEAFLLRNDDEYAAASELMLNLLDAGEIEDVHEYRLLHDRLREMLEKELAGARLASCRRLQEIENRLAPLMEAQGAGVAEEFNRLQAELRGLLTTMKARGELQPCEDFRRRRGKLSDIERRYAARFATEPAPE